MKRILFVCFLLASACTFSHAQTAQAPNKVVVTKADYNTAVSQLNTLLAANKAEEAKAKFEEVHKMMMASMVTTKGKVRDAYNANNKAEADNLTKHASQQYEVYYKALMIGRGDILAGKTKLAEHLSEFGTMML